MFRIEFETFRWLEHCGPNCDDYLGYRKKGELKLTLVEAGQGDALSRVQIAAEVRRWEQQFTA